ncbi:MAG TPA: site-2 protease family protein [Candidatus Acidoferrum sp.]|nr:site-2 protease family protein [Candidatus Acidoferrum sp.]
MPPDLAELRRIVQLRFNVTDAYVDQHGIPCFRVDREAVKEKFQALIGDLKPLQLSASVRSDSDRLLIRIFQRIQMRRSNPLINLVLMVVTIGTILFASYSLTYSMDPQVLKTVFGHLDLNVQIAMFAGSIFGIIALHESGHKLAAWNHGMDSTLPYFIPGPPPFGTFGAVISLKSPPANRDQLFDLGFSGPLVGFIVTIAVAIVSILTAPAVSEAQVQNLVSQGLLSVQEWPKTPLLMIILSYLNIRAVAPGQTLVLTQVAFAAEIGALITFLNIIPAWQLDGGHIMRAAVGPRGHRAATVIGLVVLALAGYWPFALLILIMMFARGGLAGAEPLDDVSPLSRGRKIVFVLAIAMLVLCFMMF